MIHCRFSIPGYYQCPVVNSQVVTFATLKHMQTHIQIHPQTAFYELWPIVLHDKVRGFVSHHFQNCTNQLGRKSKAGSVGGKAGQGLLKTSVQKPTGGRRRGEHEYRL